VSFDGTALRLLHVPSALYIPPHPWCHARVGASGIELELPRPDLWQIRYFCFPLWGLKAVAPTCGTRLCVNVAASWRPHAMRTDRDPFRRNRRSNCKARLGPSPFVGAVDISAGLFGVVTVFGCCRLIAADSFTRSTRSGHVCHEDTRPLTTIP